MEDCEDMGITWSKFDLNEVPAVPSDVNEDHYIRPSGGIWTGDDFVCSPDFWALFPR